MNIAQLINTRLVNQQITGTSFTKPEQIVRWMGAMQAQDYAMAKWAIGLRLPDASDEIIESAIDNADIIRTHVLRPTWHFVPAQDVHWMLALTAPAINAVAATNFRKLELDETVFKKTNRIIEKSLQQKQLTRTELMEILEKKGIVTNELRSAHIMLRAELDGIVCNGAKRGKQFTYALLNERVPQQKKLVKEEALAELALRFFKSHGPATLQDFAWWSGLTKRDALCGLNAVKHMLVSEEINNQVYWFTDPGFNEKKSSIYLLPAYDEWLISYKDRTASLPQAYFSHVISRNGIFKPTIIVDGKVVGLWKRSFKKERVFIETTFFKKKDQVGRKVMATAAKPFVKFLSMQKVIM